MDQQPTDMPAALISQEIPDQPLEELDKEVDSLLGQRKCSQCRLEFPLTAAYFHKDNADWAGFQRTCRKCRTAMRTKDRNERIAEFAQRMEDRAVQMLEATLNGEGVLEPIPHTTTILEELISCFGGSQGFAKMIFADYLSAGPGSQTRLRFAQLMVKMIDQASSEGYAKSRHDKMNDDDLDAATKKLLRKMLEQETSKQAIQHDEDDEDEDEDEEGDE